MKQCLAFCVLLLTLRVKSLTLKVSEFNFLYHFDDLSARQFTYIKPDLLKWENRLPNQVNTINSVLGDVTCIVEWNGNPLNRYELAPVEQLFFKFWQTFFKTFYGDEVATNFMNSANTKLDQEAFYLIGGEEHYPAKDNDVLTEGHLQDALSEILNAALAVELPGVENDPVINLRSAFGAYFEPFIENDLNGSRKNPIELINAFTATLESNAFELHCNKFSPKDLQKKYQDDLKFSVKNFKEKCKLDIKDIFFSRFVSLVYANKLALYTNPNKTNYKWTITQKKYGKLIPNLSGETEAKPKKIEKEETPSQSILVAYDANKLELIDQNVFATISGFEEKQEFDTKEQKEPTIKKVPQIDTQNFVATRFREKETKYVFEVVCAHFKSKEDGFFSRKRLGTRIHDYIKETKEAFKGGQTFKDQDSKEFTIPNKDKQLDFVIMGDLNAEITEIAFDFNAEITRRKSSTDIKPFTAMDFEGDLTSFVSDHERWFNTYVTGCEENWNRKYADSMVAAKEMQVAFQREVNSLSTLQTLQLLRLFEANNFETEKKIRVGELDFKKKEYYEALEKASEVNDKLGNCAVFITKALEQLNKIKAIAEGVKFTEPELNFSTGAKQRRASFENIIQCLKGFGKDAQPSEHIGQGIIDPNAETRANIIKILEASLIKAEKIDFILLHFASKVQISEANSIENYKELLEEGIPNQTYSSDHFPSIVELEITPGENFDGNSLFELLTTELII